MKKAKIVTPVLVAACSAMLAFPAAAGSWQQNGQGNWQYEENGGIVVNQWLTIDKVRYYVDGAGNRMENQWFSIDTTAKEPKDKVRAVWYYAGEGGAVYTNGWHTVNEHEYYFGGGGNCTLDGIVTVEGKRYYVAKDSGKQQSGWFSRENVDSKGNTYLTWYCAKEDGELYFDGWQEFDGEFYYFYPGAYSPRKTWMNQEDKRFYFDEQGRLERNGWFSISGVDGNGKEYTNWYFAESDGNLRRGGFFEMEGRTEYFDANGLNYRARWYVDSEKKRYYMDEGGALQTGWFNIPSVNANTGVSTDRWYYADADGSIRKDGFHEIDGKMYYFDVNGLMYQKRWLTDKQGRKMYFQEDGAMARGEWFGISGVRATGEAYTNWYYADESGYMLKKGIYTIDGKRYMIGSSGVMFIGWYQTRTGERYYYGEDGAQASGWLWLKIPVDWYGSETVGQYVKPFGNYAYFYFAPETGQVLRSRANAYMEATVEGRSYAVNSYGMITAGWAKLRDAVPKMDGYGYYLPAKTDRQMQGERAAEYWAWTTGPSNMDGPLEETWYRLGGDGMAVRAGKNKYLLKEIDGRLHVFDQYGRTHTGFVEYEGETYYFDQKNQNAAVTGAQVLDDGNGIWEYHFRADGTAVTGEANGKLYEKGRLQKAAPGSRYQSFATSKELVRLVDEQGRIVKGQTVVDGAGKTWTTEANGRILSSGASALPGVGPRTEMLEDGEEL